MRKTAVFLIGATVGLLLGCGLTFYLFVGVPKSATIPGVAIRPPDADGTPPATARIILKQEFFNEVLKSIFRDMNAPSFPLAEFGNPINDGRETAGFAMFQNDSCDGRITLLPSGSGIESALSFDNDRITAPLAFRGSYNSILGCLVFSGWTQTNLELRFDAEQQAVLGQLNIETVNLDGNASLIGGIVTPLVQRSLNQRVNPIQILQGRQITLNLPIAATNGNMTANVKDVRAQVKDNELSLFVIYDFRGSNISPTSF